MMKPDAIFQKNPDVVARPLAETEGGVLLHLDSGAYFGVNQVGLIIWDLIDGQRTVGGVIDGLRSRLADSPPQLEGDVGAFLANALERKLIVAAD